MVKVRSTPSPPPPTSSAPTTPASTPTAASTQAVPKHDLVDDILADMADGQGPPLSPTSTADAPSTSAAPLSRDVAKNLQDARPVSSKTTGVHARIAQMGHASADAVKAQVDKFLANEHVQVVGDGMVAVARAGVDWFADNSDFLLSTIGTGTDAVADGVVLTGEKLEAAANEGREKLQKTVDDLRARGTKLAAEAAALLETPGIADDKKLEAQQAWAAGKVLEATAAKVEQLIHTGTDEVKAFLAKGGSALFKVTSDLFDLVGELVHKGAKGLAAGITLAGNFLKWLVGKDTLRSTALTVFGGVRVNLVSQGNNAGVGGALYFPSFKAQEEKGKDSYFDVVAFDWGVSAASPIAGAGWSSRGGAGAGVNLYFVSASFNSMTERVFIGMPGVFGVTLGRDKERGSEINFSNMAGLAGGPALGAYLSYGVSLHTPLLDPVNKYVTRPIAKVIVETTSAIVKGAKWTYEKVRGIDRPPAVAAEGPSPSG